MFKKILNIPEFYLLLLPITIILTTLLSINYIFENINNTKIISESFDLLSILGGRRLSLTIILFWISIGILIIFKDASYETIKKTFYSIIFFNISFGLISFLTTLSIKNIYYVFSEQTVLSATLFLDKIEKIIFGDILAFKLINLLKNTFIENLILFSYTYLFVIFPIIIFYIANNKQDLRKIICSFFVSIIISFPFWFLIPAISPASLYVSKIFQNNVAVSDNFSIENASQNFINHNEYFQKIWIDKDGKFFSITSFPSLHTIMGIISMYVLIKSNKKRWLAYLLSIIIIFEVIGTFYTLQHYVLDTVFGIFVAFLSILITEKFIMNKDDCIGEFCLYNFCDFLRKG